MQQRVLIFLTPVLLLVAPFLSVFAELKLSPYTASSALVIGGVVLGSALLGLLLAAVEGRRGWPAIAKVALMVSCLFIMADLSWHLPYMIAESLGSRLLAIAVLAAIFALVGAVLWIIRDNLANIAFAGALAMCLSTLGINPSLLVPPVAAQEGPLAPVVYVILDEMVGLNGFDESAPGGAEVKAALTSVLARHGFLVYPRAFSRQIFSSRSIPDALNFDFTDDGYGPVSKYLVAGSTTDFAPLALFDRMNSQGYRVSVFQTQHMTYCSVAAVDECETYPSFNPENQYLPADEGYWMKVAAMVDLLQRSMGGSIFAHQYTAFLQRLFDLSDTPVSYFDVHGLPKWLAHIRAEMDKDGRGTFTFVHLLSPHGPHVLDRNCVPQDRWVNTYNLTERLGLVGPELEAERDKMLGWYHDQVLCLVDQLDEFLAGLEASPAFSDATIVLHGDHGHRISAGYHDESTTDQTLIDNYSTLYAIRSPGISPGRDLRLTSVQRLTAEYFSGASLGPDDPYIVIDTKEDGVVRKRTMPANW